MNNLPVSEVFYSIQGEGITMGRPSVFLRLGGCNLFCESPLWRCDSIEVWQKSKSTPFENILSRELIGRLKSGARLIITGGEPLIHQKLVYQYLIWLEHAEGFLPVTEIETNGTIIPTSAMLGIIDQFNVSPKLSTAGEQNKSEDRINKKALSLLTRDNSYFKFVISKESDLEEIMGDFNMLPRDRIILMPAGSSQDELTATREMVANLCIQYGFKYSDRLHIVIWNKKTGV